MNESDILSMLSRASEFEQLKVREDEMDELDDLIHDCCEVPVRISLSSHGSNTFSEISSSMYYKHYDRN